MVSNNDTISNGGRQPSTQVKSKSHYITIAAIIGLVILECFAMHNGINGWLLRLVVIIIAGLAGLVIPAPNTWLKKK